MIEIKDERTPKSDGVYSRVSNGADIKAIELTTALLIESLRTFSEKFDLLRSARRLR